MGPAAGPPRRRTGASRGRSLGGVWPWGLGTLALAWCHKPFSPGCLLLAIARWHTWREIPAKNAESEAEAEIVNGIERASDYT